jgi:high-affinity Fe2+/Pb2+ permease
MNNTNAVILAAVLTAGGLHLLVQVQDKGWDRSQFRIVIGAAVLLLALFLISEFWPDGARGLAVVILLTAFVMNGQKFFQLIGGLVESQPDPSRFPNRPARPVF